MASIKVCPICEKEFDPRGFHIHVKYAHNMRLDQLDQDHKKQDQDQNLKKDICVECGGDQWRLLNPSNQNEKIALTYGYSKICRNCGEEVL